MAASRSEAAVVYDAIVVGSGISGGWAAKELSERGLCARWCSRPAAPIVPERTTSSTCSPGSFPSAGKGDRQALDRDQPIQRKCYACDEWSAQVLRQRPRESLRSSTPTSPSLDPRAARWAGVPSCGAARSIAGATSTSRPTPGGHRGRLADPVRRHRPLVRSCRALHRGERTGRGPAAASRRPVPSADGAALRRERQCARSCWPNGAASGS